MRPPDNNPVRVRPERVARAGKRRGPDWLFAVPREHISYGPAASKASATAVLNGSHQIST